jgi:hypothetical protein
MKKGVMQSTEFFKENSVGGKMGEGSGGLVFGIAAEGEDAVPFRRETFFKRWGTKA